MTAQWTNVTPAGTHSWSDIAMSSDGTKLAVVDLNNGGGTGSIWTSVNSGTNWVERTLAGSHQWQAVSMSSSGSFIAACWYDSAINQGVAYSSDSGATWNTNTVAGAVVLNSISVSGDGTIIVTADPGGAGGAIYLSTNSGAAFAASAGAGNAVWRQVWVSRDGTFIIVVGDNVVKVSTNSGASWTDRTPSLDSWYDVATSSNGSKIVLCKSTGVFYSSNSGVSFTELPATVAFATYLVALSDDGATILANGDASGNLMLSINSGSSWTAQHPPGIDTWNSVALSADGTIGGAVTNTIVWMEVTVSTPGQGAVLGSSTIYGKVDYGPTFGQVYRPVNQRRIVTVAGTDTIQPFDVVVIYRKTVAAAFSVLLPDCRLWMQQPYGGFDLTCKDGAGVAAANPITFVPFGSTQTIDGLNLAALGGFGYVLAGNYGSVIFSPLVDGSGWVTL